jgi:hypothetical protein
MSRKRDIQSGLGENVNYPGYGMIQQVSKVSPTNGVIGYAPGCIWQNTAGGPGSSLWVNIGSNGFGTNGTAQWFNIDSENTGLVTLAATVTLSALLHAGRLMLLNASGGFTATLPAATGTGNIYKFAVETVSTTGYEVSAVGSDKIKGGILITAAGATAGTGCWFVSTTNVNITLNGTTTGGVAIGDQFQVQDVATNLWLASGNLTGSGTLATPFS